MGLEKAILEIQAEINKAVDRVKSRQNMQKIVDEAAVIIRRRTLLGFGVPVDGRKRERLKKLSSSYIEQRKGQAVYFTSKSGKVIRVPTSAKFRSRMSLSTKTTPSKSNLTLTGQLLDSLKGTVTGFGRGVIKVTGQRDDGGTNEDIASFVDDNGRPFLHLSNNEIKQLAILAADLMKNELKNVLTKLT